MDKDKKKKIAGAATAASAVTGATVIGTAMKDNDLDVAQPMEVSEPQDILADGGELPEVLVSGTAPTADGGILPDVEITGHNPVEISQDHIAQPATAHIEPSDDIVADGVIATDEEEVVAAILPEETQEEEFDYSEEFDEDESESLAMAEGNSGNNILEEIMDKAKETLGFSDTHEPDMPDFDNNADVGAFM